MGALETLFSYIIWAWEVPGSGLYGAMHLRGSAPRKPGPPPKSKAGNSLAPAYMVR